MADSQFHNIRIGGPSFESSGYLRFSEKGVSWRNSIGGKKSLEIKKDDVAGFVWTRITKGCQLGVRQNNGERINFLGFRDADLDTIRASTSALGQALDERKMSLTGRNWGGLDIDGKTVTFNVGDDALFDVPLPEVTSANQSKDEVMLEFQTDDTTGNVRQDALVGISFHIPEENEEFASEAAEGGEVPAKRFLDMILRHTDADVGSSADAVASFDEVALLVPRGRFEVQMHLNILKLLGQTQEYKIKYSSISRLFILPRPNPPQMLVVISLDHPIRKGQTSYSHILCQFPSEEDFSLTMDISEELLAAKNEKNGGYLAPEMKGLAHEVFAKCLKGLSGAKVTKAANFKSHAGDHCIRCSYKAYEGYLYPLERAFFFIQKPPILIYHEDIDCVEFLRQGMGVVSGSAKTFDLQIRTKNTIEQQFRGIQRTEWPKLFEFITAKHIRVDNLRSAQNGPGGQVAVLDIDDGVDPGIAAANMDKSDESDSDYDVDAEDDDGGEPSSGNDSSSGAEMVSEGEVEAEGDGGSDEEGEKAASAPPKKKEVSSKKSAEKKTKRSNPEGSKPSTPAPKKVKKAAEEGAPTSGKKTKKKKPKDAPKNAMSAFLYYSVENRPKVKEANSDFSFGQIQKHLGEQWKQMPAEDKSKYEELAKKDKIRYKEEMVAYKEKKSKEASGGQDDMEVE
ncbi:hypothetical protein BSKO_11605 [Bryopsis sp. KO-2023]|nr:hypothetical protein BSKO_11605 [Bryopsis sp. KO-2023]